MPRAYARADGAPRSPPIPAGVPPDVRPPVLAAGLAMAGTLIGALIAGFVALRVARVNIQAQREMARDAALRERRDRQVAPLLEYVNRRLVAYGRVLRFGRADDQERLHAALESWGVHDELAARFGWSALRPRDDSYSMGVSMVAFADADDACLETIRHIREALPTVPCSLLARLEAETLRLNETVGAVHQAADRFVLELAPPQPSRLHRLWRRWGGSLRLSHLAGSKHYAKRFSVVSRRSGLNRLSRAVRRVLRNRSCNAP
jgi:hypothetical protein